MSKIVFAWELGEGNGHVMPYVELIGCLLKEGHEVHFVFRSLHKAFDIFKNTGVVWHQSPFVLPKHVEVILPVDSYPKILHHAGYDNSNRLLGLIIAWQNLFELIKPDLIVFDYSPTALLASKSLDVKRLLIGTGFEIPPSITPVITVTGEMGQKQDKNEVIAFENRVLGVINDSLLALKLKPLTCLTDILQADKQILRTVSELDHYSGRSDAHYAGIMNSPKGNKPEWPDFPGPKIFAYLKSFATLTHLLSTLQEMKCPVLIYGDKLPQELVDTHSSDSVVFVTSPLDMKQVGQSADVAILNAGLGATTELLLSGVPMLLLPLNGEQSLVSKRVAALGAGIVAHGRHPVGMKMKLKTVINDTRYKEAAVKFAKSYEGTDVGNLTKSVLETINSLLLEE